MPSSNRARHQDETVGHPGEKGAVDENRAEILGHHCFRQPELVDGVVLVALERRQHHEQGRHQSHEGGEQENALLERIAGLREFGAAASPPAPVPGALR